MTDTKKPDVKPFSSLIDNQAILKAIENKGFTTATPVQTITIPEAIKGKDLVVQAQTGSGKTLAFSIPMLSLMAKEGSNVKGTFGFVISPTRELAAQIAEVINETDPDVSPVLLIGGVPYKKQFAELKKDSRVVIGTPGRVLDFIKNNEIDISACKVFVLDEADEMFSMGFYEDVEEIISHIPEPAQGLFVSATISPRVKMLAKKFLKNPQFLEAETEEDEGPPIDHFYCNIDAGVSEKPNALCNLIEHLQPASAIVFCNTKSDTELVEVYLRRRGFDARRINSDLNQRQRTAVMEKIRAKELRFLIATDIAARGIDIEQIELVVNFNIHEQSETYVHRTGRTGRAGRKGSAISLVGPSDFMAFKTVQRELDVDFKEMKLPTEAELAEAKFQHLKTVLADAKKAGDKGDTALAKIILQKGGLSEDAPQELLELVSDMAQFSLRHAVNEKAESLDEELKGGQNQKHTSGGGGRHGGGGKHRDNRRRHNKGRHGGGRRNKSKR